MFSADKVLLNRIARLPTKDSREYLTANDKGGDDHHLRFLGTVSRCPWGASTPFTHLCRLEENVKYRVSALKSPAIHFIVNSSLIVPKGTKVKQCSIRIGPHILQNIDSWFAFLIYVMYRRGLQIVTRGDKTILPCPFYYTESHLKALPIFMGQQLGVHYEFVIEGISVNEEIKLVNEYASSTIESNVTGGGSITQHVPWFQTTTVDVKEKRVEISLSSSDKIIRAIYFRVYDDENEDLDIIESVEITPEIGKVETIMCREEFKNRYDSRRQSALPYYVYPLCIDPKSKVPGYGEVFKNEKLILELKDVREGMKIDVALESLDRVSWME